MTIEQIEKDCREMAQRVHLSEHGKSKSDLWICGDILLPSGKETKCAECKDVCYYDTKLKNQIKKKNKKICVKCAWKNHLKDMSALEQDILNRVAKANGWKK